MKLSVADVVELGVCVVVAVWLRVILLVAECVIDPVDVLVILEVTVSVKVPAADADIREVTLYEDEPVDVLELEEDPDLVGDAVWDFDTSGLWEPVTEFFDDKDGRRLQDSLELAVPVAVRLCVKEPSGFGELLVDTEGV
jgi:hypothetical protein